MQNTVDQVKESEKQIDDQQKKASQKLEESEEKFRKLFQLSPAGISLSNRDTGKVFDINETFLEITGYDREEVVGHSSEEMDYLESEERQKLLVEFNKNGFLKNSEINFKKKSGDVGTALFSAEPIIIDGEPCVLTVVYDITKRLEDEKAKDKLVKELEKANKELESFTYSVSHDLRAPLRGINGFTQILQKNYNDKFDEEGKRLMNTVKDEAVRMGKLIDDLLSFSRIGRAEIKKNPIDMTALAKSVLEEFLKSNQVATKITINELQPASGDKDLLRQVFINLFSNAVKFSRKNERPVIEVGSSTKDNEIIYYVRDNGVGFNMQFYDKLFKVFQRLHSQEEFEGTGIGLAIVNKIISKHGGRLWAEAKVNEGATFYFALPK